MFSTFSARRTLARPLAIVAAIGAAVALTAAAPHGARPAALFGGPWISVETPVNPYDASTRGALLLVHTFHHGTPTDMPLTGKAEGLVDGHRRSVALDLAKSSRPGTHAVRNQWGSKGLWTVVITATPHGDTHGAQAVVDIGLDGQVSRVQVPTHRPTAEGAALRQLSATEIDRALRERARTTTTAAR
jgi:hypothetical protein